MWEFLLAVVVVSTSGLTGFRWWLDRVHPPQPSSEAPEVNQGLLQRQIDVLKEDIQDLRLGKAFRGQGREEE